MGATERHWYVLVAGVTSALSVCQLVGSPGKCDGNYGRLKVELELSGGSNDGVEDRRFGHENKP